MFRKIWTVLMTRFLLCDAHICLNEYSSQKPPCDSWVTDQDRDKSILFQDDRISRAAYSDEIIAMNKWVTTIHSVNPKKYLKLEERLQSRLKTQSAWSKKQFSEVDLRLPVVYFFSGMDLVTAAGIFPNSSDYTLLAEFPFGNFECFLDSNCTAKSTNSSFAWFGHVAARNFAFSVTTEMSGFFKEVGILPSLVLSMHFLGYHVVSGQISQNGKASSLSLDGCRSNGESGCEMSRFTYVSAWMDSPEVFNDVSSLIAPKPWASIYKAGPHFLFAGKNTWFTNLALEASKVIVQDESGVVIRDFLNTPMWSIRMYGDFLNYTKQQANNFLNDAEQIRTFYQTQGGALDLPFQFGYQEYGVKIGCLLVAVKQTEPTFLAQPKQQPPKLVIVLSTQRSGSSWLTSLIGTHPDVFFDRKQESLIHWTAGHKDRLETMGKAYTAASYLQDLDGLWESLNKPSFKAVGFKLMWNQIPFPLEAAKWFREHNAIVVHIERLTTVLQLASSLQAHHDGHHLHRKKTIAQSSAVTIPPFKVKKWLDSMKASNHAMHSWSRSWSHRYIHVTYEDILRDTHKSLAVIFNTIGLFDKKLKNMNNGMEVFYRVHELPCHERIANFEEIEHLFANNTGACECFPAPTSVPVPIPTSAPVPVPTSVPVPVPT